MLKTVNALDPITAARLVELLAPTTPWNRSLWSLNTVLTLKEVLEAAEASRAGILGEDSLKRLGSLAMRLVGKDPGVLDEEKRVLNDALRTSPRFDGLAYHTVAQLVGCIESDYVLRWAAALSANPPPEAERTARSIAAYLLDRGLSGELLYSWWTKWLYQDPIELSLVEILEHAQAELVARPLTEFEVLIAFRNSPKSATGFPNGWLKSNQLSQWLRENHFAVAHVRPSGGLTLMIRARDANGAAQLAAARIDHFVARSSVATNQPLEPWPVIWVRGEATTFPFGPRPRGVRVKALYREDQLFSASDTTVDAAIELLAHLESSSPSAAIAGGWAAIEALLAEPHDRSGAADSLASIVACSFPRAELTVLSYIAERTCPDLQAELQACNENRERAGVIARAIVGGHSLNLRRHSDRAAYLRMQKLLRSPSKVLSDIQTHLADAFYRLYRQRNLILHGGKTNSVALGGSLRTASKLVGAGMDRIAHAWYVKNMRPIELAARSKSAILLVPENDPIASVNLLGM
jgi:hypothetical protein